MARRRYADPFEKNNDDPDADVSPLIDVAFLLLIYFIVTTTLLKEEADIGMALPGIQSEESEQLDVDQLMIKVMDDGSIWVNEQPVGDNLEDRKPEQLMEALERYSAAVKLTGSESMVIVDVANGAKHQRFVDVLNACHVTGLKNISLAQPTE